MSWRPLLKGRLVQVIETWLPLLCHPSLPPNGSLGTHPWLSDVHAERVERCLQSMLEVFTFHQSHLVTDPKLVGIVALATRFVLLGSPAQAESYVPPKLVARLVDVLFHKPFCHGFPALSDALVEYIRHADHSAHAELAHAHTVIASIEHWRRASVTLLERGNSATERPFEQELEALAVSLAGLEYVQVSDGAMVEDAVQLLLDVCCTVHAAALPQQDTLRPRSIGTFLAFIGCGVERVRRLVYLECLNRIQCARGQPQHYSGFLQLPASIRAFLKWYLLDHEVLYELIAYGVCRYHYPEAAELVATIASLNDGATTAQILRPFLPLLQVGCSHADVGAVMTGLVQLVLRDSASSTRMSTFARSLFHAERHVRSLAAEALLAEFPAIVPVGTAVAEYLADPIGTIRASERSIDRALPFPTHSASVFNERDVQRLVQLYLSQSLDSKLRASAAEQLAALLKAGRHTPIMYSREFRDAVLCEVLNTSSCLALGSLELLRSLLDWIVAEGSSTFRPQEDARLLPAVLPFLFHSRATTRWTAACIASHVLFEISLYVCSEGRLRPSGELQRCEAVALSSEPSCSFPVHGVLACLSLATSAQVIWTTSAHVASHPAYSTRIESFVKASISLRSGSGDAVDTPTHPKVAIDAELDAVRSANSHADFVSALTELQRLCMGDNRYLIELVSRRDWTRSFDRFFTCAPSSASDHDVLFSVIAFFTKLLGAPCAVRISAVSARLILLMARDRVIPLLESLTQSLNSRTVASRESSSYDLQLRSVDSPLTSKRDGWAETTRKLLVFLESLVLVLPTLCEDDAEPARILMMGTSLMKIWKDRLLLTSVPFDVQQPVLRSLQLVLASRWARERDASEYFSHLVPRLINLLQPTQLDTKQFAGKERTRLAMMCLLSLFGCNRTAVLEWGTYIDETKGAPPFEGGRYGLGSALLWLQALLSDRQAPLRALAWCALACTATTHERRAVGSDQSLVGLSEVIKAAVVQLTEKEECAAVREICAMLLCKVTNPWETPSTSTNSEAAPSADSLDEISHETLSVSSYSEDSSDQVVASHRKPEPHLQRVLDMLLHECGLFSWLPKMVLNALAHPSLLESFCRLLWNMANVDTPQVSTTLMVADLWPVLIEVLDRDSIATRAANTFDDDFFEAPSEHNAAAECLRSTAHQRHVYRLVRDQWVALNAIPIAHAQWYVAHMLLQMLPLDPGLHHYVLHCTPLVATVLSSFVPLEHPCTYAHVSLFGGGVNPDEDADDLYDQALGSSLAFTGYFGWACLRNATCAATAATAQLLQLLLHAQSTKFKLDILGYRLYGFGEDKAAATTRATAGFDSMLPMIIELLEPGCPRALHDALCDLLAVMLEGFSAADFDALERLLEDRFCTQPPAVVGGSESHSCSQRRLGARLCQRLLHIYHDSFRNTTVMLPHESLKIRATQRSVSSALGSVLMVSASAKEFAMSVGFLPLLLRTIDDVHALLCLEQLHFVQHSTKLSLAQQNLRLDSLRAQLLLAIQTLKNFLHEGPSVRSAAMKLGLTGLVGRMWNTAVQDPIVSSAATTERERKASAVPVEMTLEVIAMLCNYVAQSAEIKLSFLQAHRSNATLIQTIMKFSKASPKICPAGVHRLVLQLLSSLGMVHECRVSYLKANFLVDCADLLDRYRRHRDSARVCDLISFFAMLSFNSDMHAHLLHAASLFETLLDLLASPDAMVGTKAILLLRNLCFHSECKLYCLSNKRALPSIMATLSRPSMQMKSYASSALWALLYNNQKVKTTVKQSVLLECVLTAETDLFNEFRRRNPKLPADASPSDMEGTVTDKEGFLGMTATNLAMLIKLLDVEVKPRALGFDDLR